MARVNYLIGRGELLADAIDGPRISPDKLHPYEVDEARARLAPQLGAVVESLSEGPIFAPAGIHVAKFLLHPAYVAKSYSPQAFFRRANLEPVGSRERLVVPEKHVRKQPAEVPYATSEIFVAGTLDDFEALASLIEGSEPLTGGLELLREFEEISVFTAEERLKPGIEEATAFEVVLHLPHSGGDEDALDATLVHAAQLGLQVHADLGFLVGGLLYLPVKGSAQAAEALAAVATVRLVRPMPSINVSPIARTFVSAAEPATLPTPGLVRDPDLRVAILDGGLPANHPLGPWLESYREMDEGATNAPGYEQHGLAVASAFLFGPLKPSEAPSLPPAKVSVFRVLDSHTDSEDPFELYRTLGFVEEVLLSRSFDYVNLSLGPALPVEDSDVHAWTALIDELLNDGTSLLTVAVGNNGDMDRASGNARIQVPGDAVNALAVGAYSGTEESWDRAPYSAVGPGRSPGFVKPDIVAFGGASDGYFHVVSQDSPPQLTPSAGTSLAAPLALRFGATIRAVLGDELSPLAVRALTIHTAKDGGLDRAEVGWGRLDDDPLSAVQSLDGTARVVYQGELRPGKYVRARVPLPATGLTGKVRLTATFCFTSPVDSESPDTYTKAGLEARFRPDLQRFDRDAKTPRSRSFFTQAPYADEGSLRAESGKWETVLHGSEGMTAATLQDPAFDIHYIARDGGGYARDAGILKYALVITIEAPQVPNLHDGIIAAYPGVLIPIEPEIELDLPAS